MELGLAGKVAVVMASSRGLGRATAMALAEEGCNLAICSRSAESIERAAAEIRAKTGRRVFAGVVDVKKPDTLAAFVKHVEGEYGAVNILVNNSGGPKAGRFDDLDVTDFQVAAELLLLNVVGTTKAFLPMIRKAEGIKRILTITSIAVREPIANLMLSNSLRAAVTGWSKTLARELGPEKITVNCVAPGTIATERIEELAKANAARMGISVEQVVEQMRQRIPMGRFGEPAEFAAAIAFLCGKPAGYISGTTVYVDGAALASVV